MERKARGARVGMIEEVVGRQKFSIQFEGEAHREEKGSSQIKHMPDPTLSTPCRAPPAHIPPQAPPPQAPPPQAPPPQVPAPQVPAPQEAPAPVPAQQANAADATNSIPDEEVDFILHDVSSDDSADEEAAAPPIAIEEADSIDGAAVEEEDPDHQDGVEDMVEEQAGILGGLEQEDVHKTKWTKYMADKKKLIDDGLSVQAKTKRPSLAVGVHVHEVLFV